jgi:hypothetical protein
MNTFDAINHAMATLASGGYSTKDVATEYRADLYGPIGLLLDRASARSSLS